jgi:hypothetical protein
MYKKLNQKTPAPFCIKQKGTRVTRVATLIAVRSKTHSLLKQNNGLCSETVYC